MISAARRAPGRFPAPRKVEDAPGLVEEFRYDADGTAYRVVVVTLSPESQFVIAEPCAIGHDRAWMPINPDVHSDLAVTYIAEKLGLKPHGEDARNLTLLIAYALDRPALVFDDAGEYLERRVPA